MSNIYRIENDSKFQWLGLEAHDLVDLMPEEYTLKQIHRFSFHNLRLGERWHDVNATFKPNFDRLDDPIPDISDWLGHASLVLSERAFDVLGGMLKEYGELLPFACNGDTFHIFNCMTLTEVDESKSKQSFFQGLPVGIEKIVFNDEAINGKIIFKTKFNSCSSLFCGTEFKNVVEKNQLKGILFCEDLVPSFD